MHIVTGHFGFIGKHLAKALKNRGDKVLGIEAYRAFDFLDEMGHRLPEGSVVAHQGAISETTCSDRSRLRLFNVDFPKRLLDMALNVGAPFVYASSASVYGQNARSSERPENENPLNWYAESKLEFDNHVRQILKHSPDAKIVGLRYFNVYGDGEYTKGKMASMPFQMWQSICSGRPIRLFEGSDAFRRDFVHVDDVIRVNLAMLDRPISGIYNVGTGRAETFAKVARSLIELMDRGMVKYIPFPEELRPRYQTYTVADLTSLYGSGTISQFYDFLDIDEGLWRLATDCSKDH